MVPNDFYCVNRLGRHLLLGWCQPTPGPHLCPSTTLRQWQAESLDTSQGRSPPCPPCPSKSATPSRAPWRTAPEIWTKKTLGLFRRSWRHHRRPSRGRPASRLEGARISAAQKVSRSTAWNLARPMSPRIKVGSIQITNINFHAPSQDIFYAIYTSIKRE